MDSVEYGENCRFCGDPSLQERVTNLEIQLNKAVEHILDLEATNMAMIKELVGVSEIPE